MARAKRLSQEDQAILDKLKGELGARAAFFPSPIGLIALAPPEQAAEHYWTMREEMNNEALEATGVQSKFVLPFVAHPSKDAVRDVMRRLPALALRLSTAATKILGSGIDEDPLVDPEEFPEDAETLAALKREYFGEISWYRVPSLGLVVLAPPKNPACYRQFYAGLTRKEDANEEELYTTFALDLVVHPKRESVKNLLLEYPALARVFALRGDGLCGGDFRELGNV